MFYIFSGYLQTFKRNQINSDATEYYSFVTAAFECKDLSFKNGCPKDFWAKTTADGKPVNKRTVGMAYMYTPFYFVAQGVAALQGKDDDGYSKQTQKILVVGIWIYVCIGLFFLGKALFRFFRIRVVLAVLAILTVSTNLIWYTNGEVLFTHGVNFMWLSILIYSTIVFYEDQKKQWIILIALSVSMLALIRPNNILFVLIPLLYGINNGDTFFDRIIFLFENYRWLLLAIILFFIPIIPQFLYWKYATGDWMYYSYQDEKFFWVRPLIIEILFSFRKGWLIYTPVMILSVVGIFFIRKSVKEMLVPVLVVFPLFIYVTSCWWAWSYGGCFGMRPMIDIYALLAFPLAACIANKKWIIVLPIFVFICFSTWLNIFQSWQYSRGILHYDQMNKRTYFSIWRKKIYPQDYDLTVSYPDYQKELKGKGSFYRPSELTEGEFCLEFIRGRFLSSVDTGNTGLCGDHQFANNSDAFQFVYNAAEDKFLLRSWQTGLYLRMDKNSGIIYADETNKFNASLFKLISLGENKFALKAPNDCYVNSKEVNQFLVWADAPKFDEYAYVVIKRYIP